MHWAAHLGDLGALSLLDSVQAELRALDAAGASPLHRAVLAGHTEAIGFLLDRSADLALRTAGGSSCLDIAAERCDRDLQALFLRSSFTKQLKLKGTSPRSASPTSCENDSGKGGVAGGPLRIPAWAPMGAGIAACWAGAMLGSEGGRATASGDLQQACESREQPSTSLTVDGCNSLDELLQSLASRLPESDEVVCIWANDCSGKPIELLSAKDVALPPECFPVQMRLLRGAAERASWSASLEHAATRRLRAAPGRLGGRALTLVPAELRWAAWRELLQVSSCELPSSNSYRELCRHENEWTQLIRADANRTFKGCDEEQRQCLLRILNAYAAHNTGVGYCQGMNRIAGLLLLVAGCEREEECFAVLVCLMDRLGLEGLFRDGFPLLSRYTDACSQLLEERMPELLQHFSEEGVEPEMYIRQWFLTLFIDCLPLPLVVSVWDAIIRYGLSFSLRVAVALLEIMRDTLLGLRYPAITDALKVLQEGPAGRAAESLWLGQLLVEYARGIAVPEGLGGQ